MSKLTILIISILVPPVTPAVSFGRAPDHGLMLLGHVPSTLAQERSRVVLNRRGAEATSLAEYCAGGQEVDEKDPVLANWKGYGTFYPGVVQQKNADGSADVMYDDGWLEDSVPKGSFKPRDVKGKGAKKQDDAACELAEDVEDMSEKLKDAEKNVAIYLASQRAAATKSQGQPNVMSTAPSPAAAQAESPAPANQAGELQTLKDELNEIEQEIASTKSQLEANAKVLGNVAAQGGTPDSLSEPKTVDDLIAEYIARISQRKGVLQGLKDQLRQQEQQMAAVGAAKVSLEEMQASIKDTIADMERIRAKRDRLAAENRLDDELRAAVDSMLDKAESLQQRIRELVEAEKEAEAARKAAAEAKKKAEAARKAAEAEASKKAAEADAAKKAAEDEAARQAAEAEKAAEKAAAEAEKRAFQAGEEVEKELKIVGKGTETLNSGVHPNGNKWWRYRYEHSFVEAAVMIFISALMLFYEKLFNGLREYIYEKSHMSETSGTLYTRWLEFASLQMLACLVVFQTIWLLDHCHVFNMLAKHFPGNKFTRLPNDGIQYKRLSFDICVCLIMSLLFYFVLMLFVVHASMMKMRTWAVSDASDHPAKDIEDESEMGTASSASMRSSAFPRRLSMNFDKLHKATTFYGSFDDFKRRKSFFVAHLVKHPHLLEKLRKPQDASRRLSESMIMERFPFWQYLRASVRLSMDDFLEMSTPLWMGVILTFIVLLFLHYFLHLGYLRVMTFFLFVQCGTLFLTMYMIYKVNNIVEAEVEGKEEEEEDDDDDLTSQPPQAAPRSDTFGASSKSLRKAWLVKHTVIFMLQYTLFFLCYGVARSICQPWMWALHFWLVLVITVVSAILTVAFMIYVAPLLTVFAASMAMPPYIDTENVEKMEEVIDTLKKEKMTSDEFVHIGEESTSGQKRTLAGLL